MLEHCGVHRACIAIHEPCAKRVGKLVNNISFERGEHSLVGQFWEWLNLRLRMRHSSVADKDLVRRRRSGVH